MKFKTNDLGNVFNRVQSKPCSQLHSINVLRCVYSEECFLLASSFRSDPDKWARYFRVQRMIAHLNHLERLATENRRLPLQSSGTSPTAPLTPSMSVPASSSVPKSRSSGNRHKRHHHQGSSSRGSGGERLLAVEPDVDCNTASSQSLICKPLLTSTAISKPAMTSTVSASNLTCDRLGSSYGDQSVKASRPETLALGDRVPARSVSLSATNLNKFSTVVPVALSESPVTQLEVQRAVSVSPRLGTVTFVDSSTYLDIDVSLASANELDRKNQAQSQL